MPENHAFWMVSTPPERVLLILLHAPVQHFTFTEKPNASTHVVGVGIVSCSIITYAIVWSRHNIRIKGPDDLYRKNEGLASRLSPKKKGIKPLGREIQTITSQNHHYD